MIGWRQATTQWVSSQKVVMEISHEKNRDDVRNNNFTGCLALHTKIMSFFVCHFFFSKLQPKKKSQQSTQLKKRLLFHPPTCTMISLYPMVWIFSSAFAVGFFCCAKENGEGKWSFAGEKSRKVDVSDDFFPKGGF